MKYLVIAVVAALFIMPQTLFAQIIEEKEDDTEFGYGFETVKVVPHTKVKDQGRAGTCWSYATVSFIESELMRMGEPETDLSELYFVYYAYINKANRYIMRHGQANFSQGGQAHDVMNVLEEHGMVRESDYTGINYGEEEHNHYELSAILEGMLEKLNKRSTILPIWDEAVEAVLSVYLGETPEEVDIDGKILSPVAYANEMKINPADYIEITSYTNYPLHEQVNLDIPDNWSNDLYYNVSLGELVEVINNSIDNGYSVVWDGDVSEKGFEHSDGIAVLPVDSVLESEDYILKPSAEREVTESVRLDSFMSRSSTDDHLMHLVGRSKDKLDNSYYVIKNSWNADSNDYEGKLHMSLPYLKDKTVAIMVHKDAVPKKIRKKLGF